MARRTTPEHHDDEGSDDIRAVVEVVHGLAQAQSSSAAVIERLITTVNHLGSASASLYASLADLQAWAERRGKLTDQRLALLEKARQVERDAARLQQHSKQLCDTADSLTERTSELMRESRSLAAVHDRIGSFSAAPRG